MDCKEYQAFFNNTLLSISRSYTDYPTEVPKEARWFVENKLTGCLLYQIFIVVIF